MTERSFFGYFFEQHETLGVNPSVSNELYIVSTFSFYNWRLLELILHKFINVTEISQDTLRKLAYT